MMMQSDDDEDGNDDGARDTDFDDWTRGGLLSLGLDGLRDDCDDGDDDMFDLGVYFGSTLSRPVRALLSPSCLDSNFFPPNVK